ncbi:MAG: response regulator transcription factor [Rubrivivax sp.]|nr:response regulator transcription factor [Rubrivivax sp.]
MSSPPSGPAADRASCAGATPPAGSERPLRVLLIDDDTELAGMLAELLAREGFEMRHGASAAAGLALLAAEPPDLLLLDLMLPDTSGLDLCRRLRAEGVELPVLMLTARGDPIDRVIGLEIGADDYLGKPFEPRELVARVRALARRQRVAERRTALRFGPLVLDLLARRATVDGAGLALTSIEFKLLATLAAQPGRPMSRDALSAAVQPGGYMPLDRAVDVQVARLRKKLRAAPGGGVDCIETVRGEGYVFTGRAG